MNTIASTSEPVQSEVITTGDESVNTNVEANDTVPTDKKTRSRRSPRHARAAGQKRKQEEQAETENVSQTVEGQTALPLEEPTGAQIQAIVEENQQIALSADHGEDTTTESTSLSNEELEVKRNNSLIESDNAVESSNDVIQATSEAIDKAKEDLDSVSEVVDTPIQALLDISEETEVTSTEASTAIVSEAVTPVDTISAPEEITAPTSVPAVLAPKAHASHPMALPAVLAQEFGEIVVKQKDNSERYEYVKTEKRADMQSVTSRVSAPTTLPLSVD